MDDYEIKIVIAHKDGVTHILKQPGEQPDPQNDLAMLLEGVALLIALMSNNGVRKLKGRPVLEYVKSYIDKAYRDYARNNPEINAKAKH